jgi:phospholipase/lecithinase/hemolysin
VLAQAEALIARDGALDPNALHIVWAGGHDFGSYLEYGQPDLTAHPPEENVRQVIEKLARAGARHLLVGNMPDLASTPAYAGTPRAADARRLVDAYNEGLRRVARELRSTFGVDLVELDGAAAFADITMHAAEHGIERLDEAYLPMDAIDFAAPLSGAKPLPANRETESADAYFSFWAVSAGRRVHALLADKALETLRAHASRSV